MLVQFPNAIRVASVWYSKSRLRPRPVERTATNRQGALLVRMHRGGKSHEAENFKQFRVRRHWGLFPNTLKQWSPPSRPQSHLLSSSLDVCPFLTNVCHNKAETQDTCFPSLGSSPDTGPLHDLLEIALPHAFPNTSPSIRLEYHIS